MESGETPAAIVTLTPESASRLDSPKGGVTVELEADSVALPVQLTFQTITLETAPALPPGFAAGSKIFDLSVKSAEATGKLENQLPLRLTNCLEGRNRVGLQVVERHLIRLADVTWHVHLPRCRVKVLPLHL